ncbi:ice-binding family protein [Herbiconiux sp. CPCC 205763]|uniref:Ice-binding family protein n=1 Tax=Herbiconiux aconitum TaxID=2970913 RepID=A0ABT2GXV6_9MICO|nr:ice-binding family protein [Herbiconiux aconitum]MCS5719779.1 ice-binding family protein [Herbiconiux aconitum]
MRRTGRSAFVLLASFALVATGASSASAYWTAAGSNASQATTSTLGPPTGVTVPATAVASVPVSWTASAGAVTPEGYYVTRSDAADGTGTVAACSTGPTALTAATSCSDPAAAGAYRYTVTAVYRSWTKASEPSAAVTVSDPSLLGAAQSYSVLAYTAVVNTSTSVISGDVGVSPSIAVSGFPPGQVGGDIHAGDAHAAAGQVAVDAALTELSARAPDDVIVGDLGGRTLTAGTYHSVAALAITGILTLNAEGDPDAIFVFQTDAAFNTAAASRVVLENGAQPSNVYWVATGAAGTGADSFLSGTILSRGAITLGANTELIGRALSRGTVTLASNIVRFTVALPPTITIDGGAVAVTQDTTPTFSGTSNAAVSSPVTVTVAGQMLYTTVGAGGVWSVTAADLTAWTYPVVAKVREASGNGTAASQSLTVEVNPATIALGTSGSYSVLAATAVVNTGSTSLSGDLGVSPSTAVTGFPPGTLGGAIHAGDSFAATAQADLLAAIEDGSSRAPHTEIIGDLGGRTFHMGVHHSTAALAITGILTLDAQGDPDAVFIFQTDAAFDTAAASTVVLEGGAQAGNVFWVVEGAAGTGANSFLSGAVLARGAITLGASTALAGQALSLGTVTLASNAVTGAVPAPAEPAAGARLAPTDAPADALWGPAAPEQIAAPTPSPSPDPTPASTAEPLPPTPTTTSQPVMP